MTQPRFLPEVPFPPYTYVPGRTPHPVSDPAGHMFGHSPEPAELLVDDWQRCTVYLHGIDLFNHGYYWEAHEVWESLWHAAGRKGPIADFLKGLIKLAAAGVKALEGSAAGRDRHARRAAELFGAVSDHHNRPVMGLPLAKLMSAADAIASDDEQIHGQGDNVLPVLSVVLVPQVEPSEAAEDGGHIDA